MDPFSIAASAVALTETASKLTCSLAGLVRAHLTADSRITALCTELTQLTNFLESVDKTLKGYRKYDFTLMEEDLWEQSDLAMKDCKTTLDELTILINKIESHARPKGFAWRTRAVIDLSLYATEIVAARDRIHQSNWSLQTILHTMTISLQFRNSSMNTAAHEAIMEELRQLRSAIDETFHASSCPAGGFTNCKSDSAVNHNMQLLAEAAQHFYSSASSTASSSRSDRSNPSIYGDFPDSRRERVEHFVHQLQNSTRPRSFLPSPVREPPSYRKPMAIPSPTKKSGLEEDDVDIEFDRLFLDGLQELASESMKKHDHGKAIQYIKEALKWPSLPTDKCQRLRTQLACCLLSQGAWQRAAPVIHKLSRSPSDKDLVACTLLHALAVAYLSEYHFDEAMAACKKVLQWKKRLCKNNAADRVEYEEALALYATIFHMQGDYLRAEVLRRQLPPGFVYVHPVNVAQYLQSKPSIFEPLLGHEMPQTCNVAELDAGSVDMQDSSISRAGTFGSSGSLRDKMMQYNRYEDDTMKEVVFVGPCSPPLSSPTDSPVEFVPASPDGQSPLRRRLTRIFGSQLGRTNTASTLVAMADDETSMGDTESLATTPMSSPRGKKSTWLIKKSKTLLRKRTKSFPETKMPGALQEEKTLPEASFPRLPERRLADSSSVFSFDTSEDEYISGPGETSNNSVECLPLQAPMQIKVPDTSMPGPSYDPTPSNSSDDSQDQPPAAELGEDQIHSSDFTAGQGQDFSRWPHKMTRQPPIMAIPTVTTTTSCPIAQEALRNTLAEISAILASVQSEWSEDSLLACRLDLDILLDRVRLLTNDTNLIDYIHWTLKDLAHKQKLVSEQAQDSGYESMDGSRPIPLPAPKAKKKGGTDQQTLKRAFSWVSGSEDAYMAHATRHATQGNARPDQDVETGVQECDLTNSEDVYQEEEPNDSRFRDSNIRHFPARDERPILQARGGWDWHHEWANV